MSNNEQSMIHYTLYINNIFYFYIMKTWMYSEPEKEKMRLFITIVNVTLKCG